MEVRKSGFSKENKLMLYAYIEIRIYFRELAHLTDSQVQNLQGEQARWSQGRTMSHSESKSLQVGHPKVEDPVPVQRSSRRDPKNH